MKILNKLKKLSRKTIITISILVLFSLSAITALAKAYINYAEDTRKVPRYLTWEIEISRLANPTKKPKTNGDGKITDENEYYKHKGNRETILLKSDNYSWMEQDCFFWSYNLSTGKDIGNDNDNTLFSHNESPYYSNNKVQIKKWKEELKQTAPGKDSSKLYLDHDNNLVGVTNYKQSGTNDYMVSFTVFSANTIKKKLKEKDKTQNVKSHTDWLDEWETAKNNNQDYYVGYDVVNSYTNGKKYAGVVDNWKARDGYLTYQDVDQYNEIKDDRTGVIFDYRSHNLKTGAPDVGFSDTAKKNMDESYGLWAKFSGGMVADIIFYDEETGANLDVKEKPDVTTNENTDLSFSFTPESDVITTTSKEKYKVVTTKNGYWTKSTAFTTADSTDWETNYDDSKKKDSEKKTIDEAKSNYITLPHVYDLTDETTGKRTVKAGYKKEDNATLKRYNVIYVPCKKDDEKQTAVKFLVRKEKSDDLKSSTGKKTGSVTYNYYECLDYIEKGELDKDAKSLKYTVSDANSVKLTDADGNVKSYKLAIDEDGKYIFFGITTDKSKYDEAKFTPDLSQKEPWIFRPMNTNISNLTFEIKGTYTHKDAVTWYDPNAENVYPTSHDGTGKFGNYTFSTATGEGKKTEYSKSAKEVAITSQYDSVNTEDLSAYTIMYIVLEEDNGTDPAATIQYINEDTGKTIKSVDIDKKKITPEGSSTPTKIKDAIETSFTVGTTKYEAVKSGSSYKAEAFTNKEFKVVSTKYSERRNIKSTEATLTWSGKNFTVTGSKKLKKYTCIYVLCKADEPSSDNVVIIKNPGETNVDYEHSGSDYAAPDIRAYNTSDQFDLGTAIPTTDSFTVGVDVDTWYGEVEASKHEYSKTVNVTVSMSGVYHYTTLEYSRNSKGKLVSHTKNHYQTLSRSYTYTWDYGGPTTYWSVDKVNLFELDNSNVQNNAYAGTKGYASNITIPYRLVINPWTGNNLNQYDYRTTGTSFVGSIPRYIPLCHVEIPKVKESLSGSVGQYDSTAAVYAAMEQKAYSLFKAETNKKYLVAHSDTLELNGKTYISEKKGLVVSVDSKNKHKIGTESNDKFQSSSTTTIPKTTPNGLYSTVLTSNYHRILKTYGNELANKKSFEVNDRGSDNLDETGDENRDAIKAGYTQNEPIAVHSPVISPFHITNGESKTQSARENPSLTQLIPDKTYHVQFDFDNLFERFEGYVKGYSLPAGFTKYVEQKEVRFPFPVKMNGVYYPIVRDGYTDWISLGGSCVEFDFYVPTWAETGIYDSSYTIYGNRTDINQRSIQTRVWANNSSDVRNAEGYEYNSQRTMYVADYDYPVQISLIAYDFKVLAVSDEISFGEDGIDNGYHNLVKFGKERRVGKYNRFGESYLRYTYGEDVTTTWDSRNTLPFAWTKSDYLFMGELHAGDTFSYSLKTISGAIDRNNDYIEIVPTYRYVAPDGTVTEADDLALYFNAFGDKLIPYGSERDKNSEKQTSYLGNLWYKFATCLDPYNASCSFTDHSGLLCGRYINGFDLTHTLTGKSITDIAYEKVELGNVSHITLTSDMMLFAGDEKELYENSRLNSENVPRYNGRYNNLATIPGSSKTFFDASMQEWYGTYSIPNRIFVAPRRNADGSTFSLYTENGINGWFSEHGEGNAYITEEDINNLFKHDGYLVLNFKFNVCRNGELDATYYANGLDMWQRENGGNGYVTAYDGAYEVDAAGSPKLSGTPTKITLRSGDVAIINVKDAIRNDQANGKVPGLLYLD